eukprot:10971284-Alexandrium_andersonii.AAC.1
MREDGSGAAVAAPALAILGPAGPGDGGAPSVGSDAVFRAASMPTAISAVLSTLSGAAAPTDAVPASVAVTAAPSDLRPLYASR